VLATTEAHKVPPTILSRVQRYEFRRMQPADILGRLTLVAKQEKIAADQSSLQRLAFLADGAMRDALVLLEQARGFAGNGKIDDAVLDAAFGAPIYDLVERTADAIAASDPRAVLASIAEAIDRGSDPSWLAKELLRWFRLALLAQVSPQVMATEVPPETASRIAAKASDIPRTRILATLRNLSDAISQRYSAQPRIDLELALIRVVLPSDELSLQTISDRLRALEERAGSAPSGGAANGGAAPSGHGPETKRSSAAASTRKTERTPSRTVAQAPEPIAEMPSSDIAELDVQLASGDMTPSKFRALWPLIVSAVKDRSKMCFGHLDHAVIVDATVEKVTLGVPSKFNRDLLADKVMVGIVADATHEVAGIKPAIECIVVPELATRAKAGPDVGAFSLAESVLGADLL
jgi:DNA polymerase III gamma/tau subunit